MFIITRRKEGFTEMKPKNYRSTAISFSKISLSYRGRTILDEISFTIAAGEIVALVGPNGVGKTTIIRMILGQVQPDVGDFFVAKNLVIGYMPQTVSDVGKLADSSIFNFMLSARSLDRVVLKLKQIYTKIENSNKPENVLLEKFGEIQNKFEQAGGYEAEGKIKAILSGLQIPIKNLNAPVASLSGGMKTRLFLARVLFSEPDVFLLDEPTNHLDEKAIGRLGDYLKKFKGAGIVVSHRQEFLDRFCQRTFYLNPLSHNLEIYRGNYSFFLDLKNEREKRQKKLAAQQKKEIKKIWRFINRWRAGSRAKQAQSWLKKLKKIKRIEKPKKGREINAAFPVKEEGGDPVVVVHEIVKSYDKKQLFSPLSFNLRQKERMAIMGPNGVGKTTLLKIIVGLEQPDAGEISLGYKVSIGYYAQEHELLNPKLNPVQQLGYDFPSERYQRIRAVLGHFLLSEQSSTLISKLSQGEKTRLALAKVVMSGANFLVLDEPTNHLDAKSRERLIESLTDYKGSILAVSHDEEFLASLNFKRILILPTEKIIFAGSAN